MAIPPMLLPLDPVILHGGSAWIVLPEPPPGHLWRVEWRVTGADSWNTAAQSLSAGEHLVPDTDTPEPQHRIEWQAVAVTSDSGARCTICGAGGAKPQSYSHPYFGPVALCEKHRLSELDWA